MRLRDTVACKRSRYLPGVSPSSRSGTTKASLLRANELDFECIPGERVLELESEPCRKRLRVRKPPRLVLPDVDVELRALLRVGGVGEVMSSDWRPKEPMVEDLSLKPSLLGGARTGEECE